MKNLKKVLSLVLALAMALSLMTAAFAADASDYKDYSKVTYKEAVDVMMPPAFSMAATAITSTPTQP